MLVEHGADAAESKSNRKIFITSGTRNQERTLRDGFLQTGTWAQTIQTEILYSIIRYCQREVQECDHDRPRVRRAQSGVRCVRRRVGRAAYGVDRMTRP